MSGNSLSPSFGHNVLFVIVYFLTIKLFLPLNSMFIGSLKAHRKPVF
jgi:hypothetical protein